MSVPFNVEFKMSKNSIKYLHTIGTFYIQHTSCYPTCPYLTAFDIFFYFMYSTTFKSNDFNLIKVNYRYKNIIICKSKTLIVILINITIVLRKYKLKFIVFVETFCFIVVIKIKCCCLLINNSIYGKLNHFKYYCSFINNY